MPKTTLPRIEAVEAAHPFTLRLRWSLGETSDVDISGMVTAYRVLAPLRSNPDLFAKAKVGEYGTHVAWTDEIDLAATTLWRLAQEQSGATMSADAFHRWRLSQSHTLDTAARALGLSRRMVAYYDRGEKPVPRTVALAAKALEMGVG